MRRRIESGADTFTRAHDPSVPSRGGRSRVRSFSATPGPRLLAAAALACVGLIGCGGERVSSAAPSLEEARNALREVLTAWKEGKTADLERRVPPLRFYDLDRDQGVKLFDFVIKDPSQQSGPVVEVPVTLKLQYRKGAPRSHNAVYQVTTQPDIVVLRSDP